MLRKVFHFTWAVYIILNYEFIDMHVKGIISFLKSTKYGMHGKTVISFLISILHDSDLWVYCWFSVCWVNCYKWVLKRIYFGKDMFSKLNKWIFISKIVNTLFLINWSSLDGDDDTDCLFAYNSY